MILPQLQEALVVASDQMVARQRRRTQRFRLGLMTSAAVVTLGGGAVASQSLWAPLVGWEDGNRPSLSRESAPAAQEARFGVLRRDQTAGDRGTAARAALATMSGRYAGVKVAAVRVVPDGRGASSVLVPVSTVQGSTDGRAAKSAAATTRGDALCLHVIFDGAGGAGGRGCFSTAEIGAGAAVLPAGDTVRGVVPDGVSRVRFSGAHGPVDAPVRGNVFVASLAGVGGNARLSWLAADGRPIPFAGGGTSRSVVLPIITAALPASVHDCGKALGGVVPKTLSCGPRSRAYRPAPGAVRYPSQKP
jgi:hypothetical protein